MIDLAGEAEALLDRDTFVAATRNLAMTQSNGRAISARGAEPASIAEK
jgi:hypothetical protein